jgi:hypothetical protein
LKTGPLGSQLIDQNDTWPPPKNLMLAPKLFTEGNFKSQAGPTMNMIDWNIFIFI